MKHPDTPGKEKSIWINIDYRSIAIYDSSKGEKAPTLEVVDLSKVEKDIESEPDRDLTPIVTPSTSSTSSTSSKALSQLPDMPGNNSSGSGQTTTTTRSPLTTQAPKVTTQAPHTSSAPTQTQPQVTTTIVAIKINTIRLSSDFTNNNVVLNHNQTTKFKPVITPSYATNQTLIWNSNRPDIASVDSNGIVTAHLPGKAIITASTTDKSNLSASCMVTVN